MYRFIKPVLFALEPEMAHNIALNALRLVPAQCFSKPACEPVKLMGLTFPNRVGLAAGVDSNGDYYTALGKLGFGFMELGGVTVLPQKGHDRPRVCRLESRQSLWNRMGFCNKGVDYLVGRLQYKPTEICPIGVNVAKSKDTPLERAVFDYITMMQKLFPVVDYFTINLSSPNTQDLRKLQTKFFLGELLKRLKQEQSRLADHHGKYVPLLVKVSPDMNAQEIPPLVDTIVACGVEGIVATNTTVHVDEALQLPFQVGGYSGKLLQEKSKQTLIWIKEALGGAPVALISLGGILTEDDVKERLSLGADLIQLYSAFIYHGPSCVAAWAKIADAYANNL